MVQFGHLSDPAGGYPPAKPYVAQDRVKLAQEILQQGRQTLQEVKDVSGKVGPIAMQTVDQRLKRIEGRLFDTNRMLERIMQDMGLQVEKDEGI